MTIMNEVQEKISYLPPTQQIAFWVILKMPGVDEKDFRFFSHEFAKEFRRFASSKVSGNSEEYGKFIGGVLSGLFRNGLLKRVSGGRSKLWTLSGEVRKNFEEYKKFLLEVKTYWT
jgi:hypothetical protein